MFCACSGFAHRDILLLMGLLFISGSHTCFYSPIKFSILPDHLQPGELLAGNGFMAGGSYLAVLCGLIAGGLLVEMPHNLIGIVALAVAIAGLLASFFILPSPIAHPHAHISLNLWRGTKDIIAYALSDKAIALSIFGLSWFLLLGSVFMSQFANYAQATLHANNEVYILFLIVFSVGIAIGSLITDALLKGEISLRLTSLALFGVSFFTYGMVAATSHPVPGALQNARDFIAMPQHLMILGCMLMVAICGGIYMVPLYAKLQHHTPAQYRSRVMAASNLSDAVLATVASLVSALLLSLGFRITDLFLVIATLNLPIIYYARKIT
jgi:acyl-[acyl-carrier-protein]-phospholipid O-acyltransferase/long-chain-fatty-acid--[acyl-carrier-protein] ligase